MFSFIFNWRDFHHFTYENVDKKDPNMPIECKQTAFKSCASISLI